MDQQLKAYLIFAAIVAFSIVIMHLSDNMYGDVSDMIKSCREIGSFTYQNQIFKCVKVTPPEKPN